MGIKHIDFTCATVGCIISTLLFYGSAKQVLIAVATLTVATVFAAGVRTVVADD